MFMILIILSILFIISFILLMINFFITSQKFNDREKASPFECGFDPLSSSRLPFSIHFYLISIVFLIFDVEIILLFPMIPSFSYSNFMNLLTLIILFILILLLGLYLEWNDGILTWLK